MKKIISVVGARPNFMKIAPIHRAFQKYSGTLEHIICHTGQHYDDNMSKVFFEDLELPKPKYYLGIGSGSHAMQTAKIMIEFEKVLLKEQPGMIIVVGDVNSTIACTLTAQKLNIKTAHIEAGLRSFDRTMPEEINRILTDSIADYLFVTEQSGMDNLAKEGVAGEKIFFVGNCMIDSLIFFLGKADDSQIAEQLKVKNDKFIIVTLHRPSNVDEPAQFGKLIELMNVLAEKRKIVFPIHPRTLKNIEQFALKEKLHTNIILTEPLGYIDFLSLIKQAELVLSDSGGIQEETTFLGVPCITLRTTTERPSTLSIGTNQLLGNDLEKAKSAALAVLSGERKTGRIPELWDGKAAERIAKILTDQLL
jgi:UDP-N-acetylglucosamine 2-epimerase (non-hydrolysing)